MMRAALAAGAREPLWLLSGARHEEDVLYRAEVEALAAEHPNVHLEITLSRPEPGWEGKRGYVQAHLAEVLAALREASGGVPPHAYVCGLDRMVSAVRELLRNDLGFDRKRVHAERYD
jgi:NAD(P)H-flavin reductase